MAAVANLFRYSPDNVVWHPIYEVGDRYFQSSGDGGVTWSVSLLWGVGGGDPGKQNAYEILTTLGELPYAEGFLRNDGEGGLSYVDVTPTEPGGANGSIQYNNAGSFGGLAVVDVARGGTGLSTIASGKLLYASASNTLSELSMGNSVTIESGILKVDTIVDGGLVTDILGATIFDVDGGTL